VTAPVYGEVVRIDRDVEDLAWAESRFEAMTSEVTTLWDIAQDIEANWEEGHNVSRFYGGLTASQVLRERFQTMKGNTSSLDGSSLRLMRYRLSGARAQRLAPPEYRGLAPSMYQFFRPAAYPEDIERAFRRAEELGGITARNMRIASGMGAHMKPPYWQQVISNLMTGEHDLTPATARNLIATATRWLQDNPDAPTRR
jgi:hypothetical protein